MNKNKDYIDILIKKKFINSNSEFSSFNKNISCYYREVEFGFVTFFDCGKNLDYVVFDKNKYPISLVNDINWLIEPDKFLLFVSRNLKAISPFSEYIKKK